MKAKLIRRSAQGIRQRMLSAWDRDPLFEHAKNGQTSDATYSTVARAIMIEQNS